MLLIILQSITYYIYKSITSQGKFDKSIYTKNMSFWSNVDVELKFQGISRKELAYKINAKEITIHKAIERDSVPSAESALKIAKVLNVPLERLLDMEDFEVSDKSKDSDLQKKAVKMYKKHGALLDKFESLSPKERLAITQLIDTLGSMK